MVTKNILNICFYVFFIVTKLKCKRRIKNVFLERNAYSEKNRNLQSEQVNEHKYDGHNNSVLYVYTSKYISQCNLYLNRFSIFHVKNNISMRLYSIIKTWIIHLLIQLSHFNDQFCILNNINHISNHAHCRLIVRILPTTTQPPYTRPLTKSPPNAVVATAATTISSPFTTVHYAN